MKLIVGLGNPGKKYEKTRHNVGFVVLDELNSKFQIQNSKLQLKIQNFKYNKKLESEIMKIDNTFLAKPQTYMNKSGEAVTRLVNFYKIKPKDIAIVCDDLDLPVGIIRIRQEGSSGGQKGLASIIQNLGSDKFWRLRIGIGSNQGTGMAAEDFVLKNFPPDDAKIIAKSIDKARDLVLEFIKTNRIEEETIKIM